ncbi:MAG: hypothetical protein K2X34_09960 [Hyphomonadaceae bacterium]|nr:hypothetical protein [Hyphomonadaceae bacterium]
MNDRMRRKADERAMRGLQIRCPALLDRNRLISCHFAQINPTAFTPCDHARISNTGGSGTKADSVGDAV